MPIDERFREPIRKLVVAISTGDWKWLEREALDETLTGQDIQRSVERYGKTIVALPDEAFEIGEQYEIEEDKSKLGIELPFWTKEEGRSDLEMRLWVYTESTDCSSRVVLYDVLTP